MFKDKVLLKSAKKLKKTIVFPEAGFSGRTVEAVKYLSKKKIVNIMLIGDESALMLIDKSLSNFDIVNPKTSPLREKFVKTVLSKRKDAGVTKEQAEEIVNDPYAFAALLVDAGVADGMLGGAETATSTIIKAGLHFIGVEKKGEKVTSSILLHGNNKFLKDQPVLLADCAVIPNPTTEELVTIAKQTIETFEILGLKEPKLAFLSYSTNGSAKGEMVEKVANAARKFASTKVVSEGEMQLDAALIPEICNHKFPQSQLKGNANILIFPDLNSGNICYKTMQYIGGMQTTGIILQGFKKPINDLSRGCSVEDIIKMAAVTALQSIKGEKV